MDERQTPTAFEVLDQARPLPCAAEPRRKSPSAETQLLIADLGLRYQPSAQADLEAHAGQLAFLAMDLADVDPRDLEEAIREHVRTSVFMPKAAELLALAESAEKSRIWRERQRTPALPGPRERTGQEKFDAWIATLQAGYVHQSVIDEKPQRWLNIAVERGVLRRHWDGRYEQRFVEPS